MQLRSFILLASLLVAVIFGGLNVAGQNWLSGARLDMTENRLYTLSDAAEDVTTSLAEPVELQFVYSRRLAADYPAIRAYGARVRELLAEIEARSDGDVDVIEIDPDPFTEEEDRVLDAGLQSTPTDSGDPLYFGVIGRNSVDDEIIIPFLSPEREALLEYDLVKLISQLDDPAPPRIGVLSSLPGMTGNGRTAADFYVLRELARSFEIEQIPPNFTALPDDVDALLIVHPPELSPRQQYLIEQFVLRKGRVMAAIDPVSKSAIATRGRRLRPTSSLGRVETLIGLSPLDRVVIDRSIGLPVERIENGRRIVEAQPLFIAPQPSLMSADDPITADLSRAMNFGAAGRLVINPPANVLVSTLITASEDSTVTPVSLASREVTPRELLQNYAPGGAKEVLAARVSGRFHSLFTGDIPPFVLPEDPVLAELASKQTQHPHLEQSDVDAEIILVSDADLFDDSFFVSPNGGAPAADNAAFILNAMDNLAGSDALVRLRSRAPSARPMSRVDALRDNARARLYEEQANLEARLQVTEARLDALRNAGAAGGLLAEGEDLEDVNQAQAAELARFRAEAIEIRERLREIEREFRADIDQLESRLSFFNVWMPPLLIAFIGFGVITWRARAKKGQ